MEIFFPMAGQGARFGHTFKPFLRIGSDAFIEAAVRPFRVHQQRITRFVFVYLAQQEHDFGVRRRLEEMFAGLPFETVTLDAPTRGPAETIANAIAKLGTTGPGFVCDCDHELDVSPLFRVVDEAYDALIPVWPLEGESLAAWSVATIDEGRVQAIAEKKLPEQPRGTPMGVIGCYGFRDLADVAERTRALAAINFSDVLAQMLVEDRLVRAVELERAVFFGDPERLERASKKEPS